MDAATPVSSANFEGLAQLLEALETASASLVDGRRGLEQHAEHVDDLAEAAGEHESRAETAFDELGESFAAAHEAATDAIESWRDDAGAGAEALSARQQALADEASRLDEHLGETHATVEAAATEAEQALSVCEQNLVELDTHLEHWQEQLVAAIESSGQAVEQIREGAADASEEVERHTRDLADETATSLAPRASTALEESRGVLGQAGPALHQAIDGALQGVGNSFAELAGHGLQAHEQLLSSIAETSDSVKDFVAAGALGVVSQATDAAIREALEAAAQELAELAATLAMGQGITAATAPLFPELAVAKRIAEVINDLLEALPGF